MTFPLLTQGCTKNGTQKAKGRQLISESNVLKLATRYLDESKKQWKDYLPKNQKNLDVEKVATVTFGCIKLEVHNEWHSAYPVQ